MPAQLRDEPARGRFELDTEAGVAFARYRLAPGVLEVFHTEVPVRLRGRSVGAALVRAVLEEARRRGLKVDPQCSFVRAFIARNPQYADLVAGAAPREPASPRARKHTP